MNHYLIMYVPPRTDFANNATPEESGVIERHFEYLKLKLAEGTLILAGRTDDARFGIAVIQAKNEDAARETMDNDPAVKEGVFSSELLPFRLALGGE